MGGFHPVVDGNDAVEADETAITDDALEGAGVDTAPDGLLAGVDEEGEFFDRDELLSAGAVNALSDGDGIGLTSVGHRPCLRPAR